MVTVGSFVSPGTPVFRLVADNPVKFRGLVPERHLAVVADGKPVEVTVAGAAESLRGVITRVIRDVNPVSRTFQVEVKLMNFDRAVRPGSFAKGAIAVSTDEAATFVPQDAIQTFIGVKKVFTVKDGKAVENVITTGQRIGSLVRVMSGLSGQHEVVVSGGSKLSSGSPVSVRKASPKPSDEGSKSAEKTADKTAEGGGSEGSKTEKDSRS
jgi:membrane fusion protein (multidrug efflux system)